MTDDDLGMVARLLLLIDSLIENNFLTNTGFLALVCNINGKQSSIDY